jgi:hypothetical protein
MELAQDYVQFGLVFFRFIDPVVFLSVNRGKGGSVKTQLS